MKGSKYIFRGREFSEEEIRIIQGIIDANRFLGRKAIARLICEAIDWHQFNGRLKVASCLEALCRMEKIGILKLPPRSSQGGYRPIKPISRDEVGFEPPQEEICGEINDFGRLIFKIAISKDEERLWRYLIQTYHYLGYSRLVGRYIKYFVYLGDKLVALIGFSDGVYHHNLRDKYLGWDRKELERNRHLVVNNCRFLILPWVKIKNLGSKILSGVVDVLKDDWKRLYGYSPIIIETFVDEIFKGTVYKASNWIYLGKTRGEGRRGLNYFFHGRVRHYFLYPIRS
jgi:hypothetical protein